MDKALQRTLIGSVVSLIVFFITQTGIAIWWAATITANQNGITEAMREVKINVGTLAAKSDPDPAQDERMNQMTTELQEQRTRIRELEKRFEK